MHYVSGNVYALCKWQRIYVTKDVSFMELFELKFDSSYLSRTLLNNKFELKSSIAFSEYFQAMRSFAMSSSLHH